MAAELAECAASRRYLHGLRRSPRLSTIFVTKFLQAISNKLRKPAMLLTTLCVCAHRKLQVLGWGMQCDHGHASLCLQHCMHDKASPGCPVGLYADALSVVERRRAGRGGKLDPPCSSQLAAAFLFHVCASNASCIGHVHLSDVHCHSSELDCTSH